MKSFVTEGTGSQQTLRNSQDNKIPIYASETDAEADLANLEVGQIIGITDTGDELAQPVDVVEEDNLHAVTSNAVAELFQFRSYTKSFNGAQLSSLQYSEFDIAVSDLPIEIAGYKVVSTRVIQALSDAFLLNLHLNSSLNKWRLTVFNAATVIQTIPDITISVLFMKN